jgi:hypothetical protein
MTLIAQDKRTLMIQSNKINVNDTSESYKMLKDYFYHYQHLASSESAFNHLNGGRVGLLLIQFMYQREIEDDNFEKMVANNFNSIVGDTVFLNEKLTWLPPSEDSDKLFLRNIGIYLGLSVIHQHFLQSDEIIFLLNHISFEIELSEVSSHKYRKLLKQMFSSEPKDITLSNIHKLILYYQQSNNEVVLESIICFIILGRVSEEKSISNFILSSEAFNNPFVKILLMASNQNRKSPKRSINFSENIVIDVMKKKLISLYQYCGENFMNTIIKDKQLDKTLNPTLWLRTILKEYPEKSRLFKNIVWRERMLLKLPKYLFSISDDLESYEQSNKVLLDVYKSDMDNIFKMKFKIDKSKIRIIFNSFWIGMLPIKNFAELNSPHRIMDFKKVQNHTRCSILLVKRSEKVIVWQGRSFRDNDEIAFLFYFLEDFYSPNNYKSTFGENALDDFKILGLIFWCLELGIIETVS